MKPIKPSDLIARKKDFPPEVLEAFNELIAKNFSGRRAEFLMKDAANLIASKMGIPRAQVFKEKFLDVENIYRAEGWLVTFDNPGYNEDYEAKYKFEAPMAPRDTYDRYGK
jgi:hypothetical protein